MFKDILKEMVDGVEGGLGAVLMEFDGIAVDRHEGKGATFSVETVGMEYSVVLKEILKAAELLKAGKAEDLAIKSENLNAVFRVVNDQYFIVLTLSPTGNVGKGRFLLRLAAPKVRAELG